MHIQIIHVYIYFNMMAIPACYVEYKLLLLKTILLQYLYFLFIIHFSYFLRYADSDDNFWDEYFTYITKKRRVLMELHTKRNFSICKLCILIFFIIYNTME